MAFSARSPGPRRGCRSESLPLPLASLPLPIRRRPRCLGADLVQSLPLVFPVSSPDSFPRQASDFGARAGKDCFVLPLERAGKDCFGLRFGFRVRRNLVFQVDFRSGHFPVSRLPLVFFTGVQFAAEQWSGSCVASHLVRSLLFLFTGFHSCLLFCAPGRSSPNLRSSRKGWNFCG
jgi:hypothetical protein